jgi:hypothetical protein
MSVTAQTVVNEAALLLGDAAFRLITPAKWLTLLNRAQRKMSQRLNLYGVQATFSITAGINRVALPDDCTQLRRVDFTETPETPGSYRKLGDLTEDEWEARVQGHYPTGTPLEYCARMGWFHLVPEPDTTIVDAGRMDYWASPPDITDLDVQSLVIPDMARDHLVTGLLIEGMRASRQFVEARELEQEWMTVMEPEFKERLENRSDDRRMSIRPVNTRRSAQGA